MTPYLIVLLFVVLIAYAGRRSSNKLVRYFSLGAVMLVLVAFAGLRNQTVGSDTENYVNLFMTYGSLSDIFRTKEIGYNFLSWLVRSVSDSYIALFLTISVIVVGCYVTTIVRLTRRYETAIFLFITLGAYTFFFNAARQGIAAAICFMAIPFLLDRRAIPYFLLVGFAALFHLTALIALPLYYLASTRVDWRRLVMIAVATVVMATFLRAFVGSMTDLLSNRYATYAEVGKGGAFVLAAFLVGQGAMLYLFKDVVRDPQGHYGRLLNIYLLGLVPALAATFSGVNPSGLFRLQLYFSAVAIIMWPMVFRRFGATPLRGLTSLGFLAVTVVFFVLTTSTFANLVPYSINSEIAAW